MWITTRWVWCTWQHANYRLTWAADADMTFLKHIFLPTFNILAWYRAVQSTQEMMERERCGGWHDTKVPGWTWTSDVAYTPRPTGHPHLTFHLWSTRKVFMMVELSQSSTQSSSGKTLGYCCWPMLLEMMRTRANNNNNMTQFYSVNVLYALNV